MIIGMGTLSVVLLWWLWLWLLTDARAVNSASAPLVVQPSQHWEGSDGEWSTFSVRVGTPAQVARILVSTSSITTLVVLFDACPNDASCARFRGGVFQILKSTTWNDQGINDLPFETNSAYPGIYARSGLDQVGLGLNASLGPTLNSQVVSAFVTDQYDLGSLGLSVLPSNFSGLPPQASFFTSLRNKNLIPSLSWSYTAGAKYRNKGVYGNLVFGGYDASRFIRNQIEFSFASDVTRDLVVGLQSITSTDAAGNVRQLLPNGILALIDSTLPYLWLPFEACQAFEKVFNLVWDPDRELYAVNDTTHDRLLKMNPSIEFKLGKSEAGGTAVSIHFPYESFDLNATSMINPSFRYFPLKQAANETQYILGRTFLQEAYLTADYERHNFTVSQCSWVEDVSEDIVPIPALNSTSAVITQHSANSRRLSTGAIIGVAVAVMSSLAVMSLLIYGLKKRQLTISKRDKPQRVPEMPGCGPPQLHEKDSESIEPTLVAQSPHSADSSRSYASFYKRQRLSPLTAWTSEEQVPPFRVPSNKHWPIYELPDGRSLPCVAEMHTSSKSGVPGFQINTAAEEK